MLIYLYPVLEVVKVCTFILYRWTAFGVGWIKRPSCMLRKVAAGIKMDIYNPRGAFFLFFCSHLFDSVSRCSFRCIGVRYISLCNSYLDMLVSFSNNVKLILQVGKLNSKNSNFEWFLCISDFQRCWFVEDTNIVIFFCDITRSGKRKLHLSFTTICQV